MLDFHAGQFGEGLAKESIAEIAFGIVGRIFDLAPGFDVTHEAGVGLEFFFIFHISFTTEAQRPQRFIYLVDG